MPEGCDDVKITLTAVKDLANIVVKAIEWEGEWPATGGIQGCDISIAELLRLGEEIRGEQSFVSRVVTLSNTRGSRWSVRR